MLPVVALNLCAGRVAADVWQLAVGLDTAHFGGEDWIGIVSRPSAAMELELLRVSYVALVALRNAQFTI